MVSEVIPIIRIGESAGLIFLQLGVCGRLVGNWPRAALIAACTSRAEASMLRLKSNCMVMRQLPSELDDVISFSPAMRPNCRSRGVATADAIVSGLAPGKLAPTPIVGKSTCGSGATGSNPNATTPERKMAMVISVVATGRRTKGAEKLDPDFIAALNLRV